MKLFDLITELKTRPGMYIGGNSIYRLEAFMAGWLFDKSNEDNDVIIWSNFEKWISKKFSIESSQGWAMIIRFYSSNECHAFDRAIELFEEFALECYDRNLSNPKI